MTSYPRTEEMINKAISLIRLGEKKLEVDTKPAKAAVGKGGRGKK